MIDIRWLRDAPQDAAAALARRGPAATALLGVALEHDARRREIIKHVEGLKAHRNAASERVAELKRQGSDASALLADLKTTSDAIKGLDHDLRAVEDALEQALLRIPNRPLADVPDGDAAANRVVRTVGEPPRLRAPARPHWELGEALGILDLARGAKIAGSGFPVFTGEGARLARALINFMLDLHGREHGYREVQPPLLVNAATAQGTGQLPDLERNMYVTEDGLYLIPTAEVPVTNLHRDEILRAETLPLAYAAYTPCFRREAGAHGKDTRGLIRVHQFDKVELVRLCRPDQSPGEHATLLGHAEAVLQRLGLPYRVVLLAAGDTGFASAKTYDLEVWAAGVETWLEASSASTFTDFQARRANIRYRPTPDSKPDLVHTLNASGVALPRTIVALLENNQEPDGSVRIPPALVPYLGRDRLVPP
ncbi:MAG TPA: serine--tRNA ligase [Gemmatimonadales bacterium]|nr:serine--tRNA ligase [Gemmatimonadales bacterium]